ncbi:MAG: hypothetical protein KAG98_05830, partial [Lentisphaeria bacterium]|nr:hypothetical protein [Lentisphaeria bacterium]
VTPVNDAPVLFELPNLNAVENDQDKLVKLIATDVDKDVRSYSVESSNSRVLEVSVSGNELTLNFQKDTYGTATVTVTVDDNSGKDNATATKTFTVHVKSWALDFLEKLGLENLIPSNSDAYKNELAQNKEQLELNPQFYQQLVDVVNRGEHIVVSTVYPGWNLISSPFEGFRPIDILDEKIFKTVYTWSPDLQIYNVLSSFDELKPSLGYWIDFKADNFKPDEDSKGYAIVGNFETKRYDNLTQGWNLLGSIMEGIKWDSNTPIFKWENSAYYDASGTVMELGRGYWLFNSDLPPSNPNQ